MLDRIYGEEAAKNNSTGIEHTDRLGLDLEGKKVESENFMKDRQSSKAPRKLAR